MVSWDETTGDNYYEDLRNEDPSCASSLASRQVPPDAEIGDSTLDFAMEGCMARTKQYARMSEWLELSGRPNKTTF